MKTELTETEKELRRKMTKEEKEKQLKGLEEEAVGIIEFAKGLSHPYRKQRTLQRAIEALEDAIMVATELNNGEYS